VPEEDRGDERHSLDLQVNLDKAEAISPHIYNICSNAADATYTKEADIKLISQGGGWIFWVGYIISSIVTQQLSFFVALSVIVMVKYLNIFIAKQVMTYRQIKF